MFCMSIVINRIKNTQEDKTILLKLNKNFLTFIALNKL